MTAGREVSARAAIPGEELDVAAVHAWLGARLEGLGAAPPKVTQYSGGASNWTYRLEYPRQDLVLRRPPAGTKARTAHDMGREYRVQRALRAAYPYVPEMIAHCDDPSVLGCEFYLMRRLDGVVPRPRSQLDLDARGARRLGLGLIDRLAELHAVGVDAVGLRALGRGPGYARRQIEGWSERYRRARTWNVPRFERVLPWLAERVPEDVAACVIHNDFRLDNVVLDPGDPTRIVGVLDWEMATVGDPLMDLGASLAYWVEAADDPIARATRRQPSDLPGMPTRGELVDRYLERAGRRADDWAFYEVYGLFRLAAIAQQIYFRYHRGESRNRAFRHLWFLVRYLEWRCRRTIRRAKG